MKVKLKDIVPNPFRSEIGVYSDHQIESIIESCETSEYGKDYQFDVRKNAKGEYELVYGHHRLKAFERFYGKDHEVSIVIKDYTDHQMFIEMARENLTKDNAAITHMGIFAATKKWLDKTGGNAVATCDNAGRKKHQDKSQGIGARQIAKALSKNGISVSRDTVRKHLLIEAGLAPDLKAKVGRTDKVSDEEADGMLSIGTAEHIADLKYDEQRAVVKALNKSSEHKVSEHEKIIQRYKAAPDTEKEAVRKGKMDIALVGTSVGKAVSKIKHEKPDMDGILKQIADDINHATALLTHSLVKNIHLASKERRDNLKFAVNRFLKRLDETGGRSDTK